MDRCAELCAGEPIDCTAFQFCFDPSSSRPMQSFAMIESKPTGDPNDYRVVVSRNENGEIVSEGRFFKPAAPNTCRPLQRLLAGPADGALLRSLEQMFAHSLAERRQLASGTLIGVGSGFAWQPVGISQPVREAGKSWLGRADLQACGTMALPAVASVVHLLLANRSASRPSARLSGQAASDS